MARPGWRLGSTCAARRPTSCCAAVQGPGMAGQPVNPLFGRFLRVQAYFSSVLCRLYAVLCVLAPVLDMALNLNLNFFFAHDF